MNLKDFARLKSVMLVNFPFSYKIMITFETHFIKGSASIADLFKEKNRCGIYVLSFENGEFYAGKSVDVVKRYAQHKRTHRDIQKIDFHQTSKDELTSTEIEVIQTLEGQGYKLRNIALMDNPYFETPDRYKAIDLVMTQEEQERWLEGEPMRDLKPERRVSPEQRKKYEDRMKKLEKKQFFPIFTEILKTYFDIGIPYPERTEFSSYSVSCLPEGFVYSRLNINQQEVFTTFEFKESLNFSFHIAKKPIEKELSKLKQKYPDLEIKEHKYKPGGIDQISILSTAS
jgi:hypothetical protein